MRQAILGRAHLLGKLVMLALPRADSKPPRQLTLDVPAVVVVGLVDIACRALLAGRRAALQLALDVLVVGGLVGARDRGRGRRCCAVCCCRLLLLHLDLLVWIPTGLLLTLVVPHVELVLLVLLIVHPIEWLGRCLAHLLEPEVEHPLRALVAFADVLHERADDAPKPLRHLVDPRLALVRRLEHQDLLQSLVLCQNVQRRLARPDGKVEARVRLRKALMIEAATMKSRTPDRFRVCPSLALSPLPLPIILEFQCVRHVRTSACGSVDHEKPFRDSR